MVGWGLNYEIPGANYYPISTLRVFLKRYGSAPARLEKALGPALEVPESRWGLTLDCTSDVPRPSVFGRLPWELLATVGMALSPETFGETWQQVARYPPSSWVYLSYQPESAEPVGVDLEDLPLEHLDLPWSRWPPLPEPMTCAYAKCRGRSWAAYLPWPAFAAWWKPEHSRAAQERTSYVQEVRHYYDRHLADYLEHLGTTWQAGRVAHRDAASSNLELARRARLEPGLDVLDAGCGVGGPALDMARAYPGLRVEGLTLCPLQAARAVAKSEGTSVNVRVGDFHELAYSEGSFDRVLYLESSGYAYDRPRLFREAYRVLRAGGLVYIKDVFRAPGPLRAAGWRELDRFDRLYAQHTPTLNETLEGLSLAGFEVVEVNKLQEEIGMSHWHEALGTASQPTSFGRAHGQEFRELPVFFAEVLARKNGQACLRRATPG